MNSETERLWKEAVMG